MKAAQDQTVPPPETQLSCRWTEPPQAIGRAQLISKPLKREVPVCHYQSAGTWMEKGTTARAKPQTWLFPGTAQTVGKASRQEPQPWHRAACPVCLQQGLLWPQPGHPAFTQARSGLSVRVSRSQQSLCARRQLDTSQESPLVQAPETIPALYWAAIYLHRHSHWAWNINSCI